MEMALILTAASIGFVHTFFGPDHYIPFVAMSKAGGWSTTKTLVITVLCGLAHVLSSVILGIIGLVLGSSLLKLTSIESVRGEWAAWALILFGLTYFLWGLRRAGRKHHHIQTDSMDPGNKFTPWVLMTIFALGPCEPLIPLLIYPAAQGSMSALFLVIATFGVVTVGTMTTLVFILIKGMSLTRINISHRYVHAMAGAAILLCGVGIKFLGL